MPVSDFDRLTKQPTRSILMRLLELLILMQKIRKRYLNFLL